MTTELTVKFMFDKKTIKDNYTLIGLNNIISDIQNRIKKLNRDKIMDNDCRMDCYVRSLEILKGKILEELLNC